MALQTDTADLDATEFAWKRTVSAPSASEGGVVPGIDLVAMLNDAATDLVVELFGSTDLTSLAELAVRPVLRGISAVFEAPLTPGTPVFVGATLGSLARRSFELRSGVWIAQTRQLVARGGATFVVVDAQSRKSVAVPEHVTEALLRLRPALGTAAQSSASNKSDTASPHA
ncbi:acyl-CoA thioesterase [[Mycobacterium] burgundiense]|uniref:Thioesterase n=1 Tax=[Mycobacterium] burgundiense TaxID=3064286 RepID=A0ABN9N8U6_9MYCO|nr:thioesterase family protein [Mycolicibacterium sp. MU0053]CAJ1500586.1 hypothetical protein MU0053_001709 [Mycolicibacterium sp. MU0053]